MEWKQRHLVPVQSIGHVEAVLALGQITPVDTNVPIRAAIREHHFVRVESERGQAGLEMRPPVMSGHLGHSRLKLQLVDYGGFLRWQSV